MAYWEVTLQAVATQTVSVEAESLEEAINLAHEDNQLYASSSNAFDLGEIATQSAENTDTGQRYEETAMFSDVLVEDN